MPFLSEHRHQWPEYSSANAYFSVMMFKNLITVFLLLHWYQSNSNYSSCLAERTKINSHLRIATYNVIYIFNLIMKSGRLHNLISHYKEPPWRHTKIARR